CPVYGLWYAVPPPQGGTTYGQCTARRSAVPRHRIPGCDQLDARRVSAPRPAFLGGVPRADGGVVPRRETADRPPVYGLQELPLRNAGRSPVLHLGLPQNLYPPGG